MEGFFEISRACRVLPYCVLSVLAADLGCVQHRVGHVTVVRRGLVLQCVCWGAGSGPRVQQLDCSRLIV